MRMALLSKPLAHRLFLFSASCIALAATVAPGAIAQSRDAVIDRLDRLERDMINMQREVYRGEGKPPAGGIAPPESTGRLQVELEGLREELRVIRGRMEQLEFEQRRQNEVVTQLEQDLGARMIALEGRMPVAAPPVIGDDMPPANTSGEAITPIASYPPKSGAEIPDAPVVDAGTSGGFTNAKDHYNAAFKALNDGSYDQSASLFAEFIAKYPDDSLLGNAYYWLGETHYVQKNYSSAAEQFRLGFEKMPEGPKAPDNLLKLAMSLSALKRNQEACVVLGQVIKRYGASSPSVRRRAEKELSANQCQ